MCTKSDKMKMKIVSGRMFDSDAKDIKTQPRCSK